LCRLRRFAFWQFSKGAILLEKISGRLAKRQQGRGRGLWALLFANAPPARVFLSTTAANKVVIAAVAFSTQPTSKPRFEVIASK
jgi:hypothetical protein